MLSTVPLMSRFPAKSGFANRIIALSFLWGSLSLCGCENGAPAGKSVPLQTGKANAASRAEQAEQHGIQVSQANLGDGTPIESITSEKSKTATMEERKAAVDRVFAPPGNAVAESGVSADSLKAEIVRNFLKQYPKHPAAELTPVVDEYHRQCVLLARRSDGSISADYYRKQMAWRLESYIGNMPQYR